MVKSWDCVRLKIMDTEDCKGVDVGSMECGVLCLRSRESNRYVGLVFWRPFSPLSVPLRFEDVS